VTVTELTAPARSILDLSPLPLLEAARAAVGAGRSGGSTPPDPGRRHSVALAVGAGGVISSAAHQVGAAYGADLAAVLVRERVKGSAGEVVRVPVMAPEGLPDRLLLIGIGQGRPQDLRRAGAALAGAVRGQRECVTTLGSGASVLGQRAAAEGLLLGAYAPPSAGLKDRADRRGVERITLAGSYAPAAISTGRTHAAATVRARDLAQMPSSVKTPAWLASQAAELAAAAGLRCEIWDETDLARDGFGGLIAVGAASPDAPRFVRLDYRPEGAPVRGRDARRPIVLIGKGITYDTGGISIKPRESMVSMKTDMAAAAAVLAAICACPELGVARPVTALLPIAQNSFGADSYRPADVVTVYGGRTVEILNTDAEGRIVLADAIAYADAMLDPEVIVDLATLTGAATLGLGRRNAALFDTASRVAAALVTAGDAAGELAWRMPLVEEYRHTLDSPIADLRHVPVEPVGGGAITAALFLREFAGGRPWVHLDIAGTARSDREEHEMPRGATGFGARLVLRWLESLR
jgi:leucyl aminopeptidase